MPRSHPWALVFGLLSMEHQVGSAVGSYLPGLLHDTTASHTRPCSAPPPRSSPR
ncbi:hypothetical protein [Streptomyces decoyicus]|uniref:hypothetical protein n=1 Tax=Streptomyces decoyicus TaxID=249567 RepID=UPI0033B67D5E